jgi:hypothetical protein
MLALAAAPAGATHIATGSYVGTTANGIEVEFKVFDDGAYVESWFSKPPPAPIPGTSPDGSPCATETAAYYFDFRPIVDHRFDYPFAPNGPNSSGEEGSATVGGSFAGRFTGPDTAEGTYQVTDLGGTPCASVTMTWTARAEESGSSEDCDRAKKKLKKAKRKLGAADSPEAKQRAKKNVKRAKKDVADACG